MDNGDEVIADIPDEVPAALPADDFVRMDGEIYGAHWHIFIPTMVITALYFVGWLLLLVLGRGEGTLAKLFVLVLAVGVPLLTIHAFLRFNTTRVQMCEAFIRYHPDHLDQAHKSFPRWSNAEPMFHHQIFARIIPA